MLVSRSMWMNCIVQLASNFGWAFLVTKMPQYLRDVHQTTQQAQGCYQSLPLVAGIVVYWSVGGRRTGWLAIGMTRWGRSGAMALSRVVVGIAFLGCLYVEDSFFTTLLLGARWLRHRSRNPCLLAYGQDVGGEHVGSAVGWANMWGNFGAALSPVVLE